MKNWINGAGAVLVLPLMFFLFVCVGLPLITTGFAQAQGYFGSVVGFGALLTGAMVNASLNRRRDDFLHRREVSAALRSIRHEIGAGHKALQTLIDVTNNVTSGHPTVASEAPQILLSMPRTTILDRNVDLLMSAVDLASENNNLNDIDVVQISYYYESCAIVKALFLGKIDDGNGLVKKSELEDLMKAIKSVVEQAIIATATIDKLLKYVGTEAQAS